jgi:hypothetical protein
MTEFDMTKQIIVVAESRLAAENVLRMDINPEWNPRDPTVVILTKSDRELRRKMAGRHFPESTIHMVGEIYWTPILEDLRPYFPAGMPEVKYW